MFQDLSVEKVQEVRSTENKLYKSALLLIDNEDYEDAKRICSKLLKDNPNNVEAIGILGECLKKEGNIKALEVCLEKAFILSNTLSSMNDYAQFLYEQKRSEEVIALVQSNISTVKDKTDFHMFDTYRILGNVSMLLQDLESAEEYYHTCMRLKPNDDSILVNLGSMYTHLNDINKAREYYNSAISINRKNDKAWMGLALCHLKMSDSQLYWANMKNALETNSNSKSYLSFAAKQAMNDGEYEYITKKLEEYCISNPLDLEINILFVSILFQSGKLSAATLEITKLAHLYPNDEDVIKLVNVIGKCND